jgi:hypothetical protein
MRSGIDRGVVHEDVEHRRRGRRLVYHGGDAIIGGEIADDRHATELVRQSFRIASLPHVKEDLHPFCGEGSRDCRPDST